MGTVPQAPPGAPRCLPDPGRGIEPYSGRYAEVLRRERRLVETSLYARQRLLVEPRGDPDSLVQALLPEAGVLEEPGGVPEPCAGLLARIQPPLCPSHRMDMDEPEDATMVRQARPEFIAGVVSGDTSRRASPPSKPWVPDIWLVQERSKDAPKGATHRASNRRAENWAGLQQTEEQNQRTENSSEYHR